ncbi:MAG TPA: DUF4012 domain-containing protein [bacterium]|nr:DUF4012 domain-containing protein [bacterium]HPT29596.1 DUF4012 domain-containing protein [bacterium]
MAKKQVRVKLNSAKNLARGSNFLVDLRPEITAAAHPKRRQKSSGPNFMRPEKKRPTEPGESLWRRILKKIKITWSHFRQKKQPTLFPETRFNLLRREESLWSGKKDRITWRYFLYFALILLLLAIPFKLISYYYLAQPNGFRADLLSQSKDALTAMLTASQKVGQGDIAAAGKSFAGAADSFRQIEDDFNQVDELALALSSLSSNPEVKLASEGKKIAQIGLQTAELGESLAGLWQSLSQSNIGESKSLIEVIDKFGEGAKLAQEKVDKLNHTLSSLKVKRFPTEYQDTLISLQEQSQNLSKALTELVNFTDQANNFLGGSQDRRYLFVFQNNNELRASGGFIGSYALLDVKSGRIKNLTIPAGGSYETAGGMRALVAAPEPLRLVSALWYFWDANWWPDWERSARNLMWFYEKSDGPTVDGVIAVTPTVIEDLLKVFGPVDLQADYGVTIDADNFWATTQAIIEKNGQPELYSTSSNWGQKLPETVQKNEKIAKETDIKEPKKIIGALFDKLMADIPNRLNGQTLPELLRIMNDNLNEKQILLYFSDPKLEKQVVDNSWGGKIEAAPDDYLSVVDTNIGGGKTDRVIKEHIDYELVISPNGQLEANLTISRAHQGVKGEPFTGLRNLDWLRVYVPQGSKLISASGFESPDAAAFETPIAAAETNSFIQENEVSAEIDSRSNTKIYSEDGKTVFANWSIVDPGETALINLRYELPFALKKAPVSGFWNKIRSLWKKENKYRYSLLVQSQPGALNRSFYWNLVNQSRHQIAWQYPNDLGIMEGKNRSSQPLLGDHYYYLLFKE